jgi:hypothetical protein
MSRQETRKGLAPTSPAPLASEAGTLGDLCENLHLGGGCERVSDFSAIDGSIVYADSYRVVVTPGGKVHASATCPASPRDCS